MFTQRRRRRKSGSRIALCRANSVVTRLSSMANHVGIELSPTAWRIVEVDRGAPWRRRPSVTRVRSFAVLPAGGPETEARLASLRRAAAAVVVWGLPSDHRQVMVTEGSYERMRDEALTTLAGVGIETRGVLADIVTAPRGDDKGKRRPVVVALAAAPELSAALAPLIAAGIRVRTVMTPAAALASLARTRRGSAVPNVIEVYVALEETATCIALVRDGALITARELPWGYVNAVGDGPGLRRREDVALRLGDELPKFLAAIGASMSAAGQICICGGLPELRTMTAQLTEWLDVEVEPLDSLFGIDPVQMPERADEFRERCAELRVAWAAVANWPTHINLLRWQRRQTARTVLSRAVIVAGVVAAVGIGWGIARGQWWRSTEPQLPERSAATVRPPAPGPSPPLRSAPADPSIKPLLPAPLPMAPATPAPLSAAPSPPAQARTVPAPVEPERPPAETRPTLSPAAVPVPQPRTAPSMTRPTPVPPPAGAPVAPPPRTAPSLLSRAVPPPVQVAPVVPPVSSAATPPRVAPSSPESSPRVPARETPPPRQGAPAAQARRQEPSRTAEVALPFEATLGTILYSPDRKLAIIDGRIVGVGDEIRGARVTDITSSAVLLRDAQGRLRRLTLGAAGR